MVLRDLSRGTENRWRTFLSMSGTRLPEICALKSTGPHPRLRGLSQIREGE